MQSTSKLLLDIIKKPKLMKNIARNINKHIFFKFIFMKLLLLLKKMRKRNEQGQFITQENRLFDQFREIFQLLALIYRLVPFILAVFILFNYFDFSDVSRSILLKITCGNSSCKCICDDKKTSSSYFSGS